MDFSVNNFLISNRKSAHRDSTRNSLGRQDARFKTDRSDLYHFLRPESGYIENTDMESPCTTEAKHGKSAFRTPSSAKTTAQPLQCFLTILMLDLESITGDCGEIMLPNFNGPSL
jgi:hypothetical protein